MKGEKNCSEKRMSHNVRQRVNGVLLLFLQWFFSVDFKLKLFLTFYSLLMRSETVSTIMSALAAMTLVLPTRPASLAANLAMAMLWAIISPSTSSSGAWPKGASEIMIRLVELYYRVLTPIYERRGMKTSAGFLLCCVIPSIL